jgi:hypothetical protein
MFFLVNALVGCTSQSSHEPNEIEWTESVKVLIYDLTKFSVGEKVRVIRSSCSECLGRIGVIVKIMARKDNSYPPERINHEVIAFVKIGEGIEVYETKNLESIWVEEI